MDARSNSAAGAPGTPVTAANSAAGGTPFDAVTIDGTSAVTYAGAPDGTIAYQFTGNTTAQLVWNITGAAHVAGRFELYLPAPGVPDDVLPLGYTFMYMQIGGDSGGDLLMCTSGHNWTDATHDTSGPTPRELAVTEQSVGDIAHAYGNVLPVDAWCRVEFELHWNADHTGDYRIEIYPDRTTTEPSHSFTGARTWFRAGPPTRLAFGPFSGGLRDKCFWLNGLAVNGTGMPGPASDGWADISGATSTSLAVTASLDLDGTQYRTRWTSARGSVYSTPATLTVTGTDPAADWPDEQLPDAETPTGGTGTANLLDVIREFSIATRRMVRLVSPSRIEMVSPNTPLPSGITQDDAANLYHAATHASLAGDRTLSLEEDDLALTASAALGTDDVRLITSGWHIPDQLPVYGLRPAPVSRVTYTFTPERFDASVEFAFPAPTSIVRRSDT